MSTQHETPLSKAFIANAPVLKLALQILVPIDAESLFSLLSQAAVPPLYCLVHARARRTATRAS
jgi:hypothetical protein